MDAKVIWKHDLSFTGTMDTGLTIPLEGDVAEGPNSGGFKPMELIAIGLAGCTAMDVISILQKKRQDVTNFEVRVYADRASDFPKVFTNIMIDYLITGRNVEPAAVERSIELSTTKYCPAQAMLSKSCKIDHRYSIKDA
ncbi:MAG: osmotically inducible protein OsmC [Anaerolineales bacterium]|nr:MAG: osmotically inducible protein OsmC [Anaerolineales bacterium]